MSIGKYFHSIFGKKSVVSKKEESEVKTRDKINIAYEQLAENYNLQIDHKPHNAYYDRPNTLSLIEQSNGKKILDAACGPGKYAEILIKEGADVIGFDFSPKMVEYAKERNPEQGHFFVHDLTKPLDMLSPEQFDHEFHRVLKPKGQLIISIEHPFFEYQYFNSEKYFEVEHIKETWSGFSKPVEVNSYRRPLFECISPLTSNGFAIDKLIEPLPTKEFERADPKRFEKLMKFPSFMCIRAIKL